MRTSPDPTRRIARRLSFLCLALTFLMTSLVLSSGSSVAQPGPETLKRVGQRKVRRPEGSFKNVLFKGGTVVTYHPDGYVRSGTLFVSTQLSVRNPDGTFKNVVFKRGTVVTTFPDGAVQSGTLGKGTDLAVPSGNAFKWVSVSAGRIVTFNNAGYLINPSISGDPAPSQDSIARIVGTWKNTDHNHVGCSSKQSFCKAYKVDLQFTRTSDGRLQGQLVGQQLFLVGSLNGRNWPVQVTMNGAHHGSGTFTFSPDFQSFTGEFTDVAGHHVAWSGHK